MKIDRHRYQHFSFDLWLTLIKSNPLFKIKRDELLKHFFSIDKDIQQVNSTVRYYDVLCNKISEKTGKHFDRYAIYLLILGDLEVDIDKVKKENLEEFCHLTEALFLNFKPQLIYPDIHVFMEDLVKENKTISVLSNTGFIHGEILRKVLNDYDLTHFSFQLYSDETGYSKPNFKIFELMYDAIKELRSIDKDKIVHIGDNKIADYQGAINAGFQAILINH